MIQSHPFIKNISNVFCTCLTYLNILCDTSIISLDKFICDSDIDILMVLQSDIDSDINNIKNLSIDIIKKKIFDILNLPCNNLLSNIGTLIQFVRMIIDSHGGLSSLILPSFIDNNKYDKKISTPVYNNNIINERI